MASIEWLPLLVKAGSTAMLVVAASRLAEALGPFWGALIATLPVSAGPAYLFLALRHDDDFIATSALASAACNAATAIFLIVSARLAHLPPWRGVCVSLIAWTAACWLINLVSWTTVGALMLNLLVFGLGMIISAPTLVPAPLDRPAAKGRFDLLFRAASVALLVTGVVTASAALGPTLTGYAAVFPISLSSTIVILRPRIGAHATAVLAATALRAMLGFGLALLVVHLAARAYGTSPGLLLGLVVSLLWSTGLLVARPRG